MRKILVMTAQRSIVERSAVLRHVEIFRMFGSRDFKYTYWNAWYFGMPPKLIIDCHDVIIFDYPFCDMRFRQHKFNKIIRGIKNNKNIHEKFSIIMPQDEFVHLDILNQFVHAVQVDVILSVANSKNWPIIYPDYTGKIFQILTAYVPDNWMALRDAYSSKERFVDIFYRAHADAKWGRFNMLKKEIGEAALNLLSGEKLKVDIKIGSNHFLLGDSWLQRLGQSKVTLGTESGVDQYWRKDGSVDEEQHDNFLINCISPRHLEAGICGTAQVLIEGEYSGIMVAGEHYISVKSDFSNLKDSIDRALDPAERERLTSNFEKDILRNEAFSYATLVRNIEAWIDEAKISHTPRPNFPSGIISIFNTVNKLLMISNYFIKLFIEKVRRV